MVQTTQLPAILEACDEVGELLFTELRRGWPNGPLFADAPVKMRDALTDLLRHLLTWQKAVASEDSPAAATVGGSSANADKALRLVRRLFEVVGQALGMEEESLSQHLDLKKRQKIFEGGHREQTRAVKRVQPGMLQRLFQEGLSLSPAAKMADPEGRKSRATGRSSLVSRIKV